MSKGLTDPIFLARQCGPNWSEEPGVNVRSPSDGDWFVVWALAGYWGMCRSGREFSTSSGIWRGRSGDRRVFTFFETVRRARRVAACVSRSQRSAVAAVRYRNTRIPVFSELRGL